MLLGPPVGSHPAPSLLQSVATSTNSMVWEEGTRFGNRWLRKATLTHFPLDDGCRDW